MVQDALLKSAKAVKPGRKSFRDYSDEEIVLALGWLTDDIRESQVASVMTFTSNNARHWLAGALQAAHKRGFIKVRFK